jgi:pimeloyl-ACP methyl ester carboxylesterase
VFFGLIYNEGSGPRPPPLRAAAPWQPLRRRAAGWLCSCRRARPRRYLVPGFLVRDPFDNLSALGRLQVPLLIVHGTRDRLVPHAHARALQAALPGARLVSFETDHNDALTDDPRFWREVASFLRGARILPSPPAGSPDEIRLS